MKNTTKKKKSGPKGKIKTSSKKTRKAKKDKVKIKGKASKKDSVKKVKSYLNSYKYTPKDYIIVDDEFRNDKVKNKDFQKKLEKGLLKLDFWSMGKFYYKKIK